MKKAFIPLLVVLALLTLVGWLAISQPGSATAAVGNKALASTSAPLGIPAIRPGTNSANVSTPAFTVADVEQYINTNPMPRNLNVSSRPTIVKIVFITSQAVSALLNGETTGLPDTALVCYAELQGTFVFPGPGGGTAAFQKGYEVFDAHTGNLIMFGGLR